MNKYKLIYITIAVLILALFVSNYLSYDSSKIVSLSNKSNVAMQDITSDIQDIPSGSYGGSTSFNYDDDDELELIVSGYGVPNIIIDSNEFHLYGRKESELSNPKGLTKSITACDLDGNGRDELLVLNEKPSASLLFKRVNGKWLDQSSMISNINMIDVVAAVCLDHDGDGKFEIFVGKKNKQSLYLKLNGELLENTAKEMGIIEFADTKSALVIPDKQGHHNIFVGIENGSNLFFKYGNGKFIESAEAFGVSDEYNNARGISLIDINSDEQIDLVHGNFKGPLRVYTQSESSFSPVNFKGLTQEVMVSSLGVADFDLDGSEDIYINSEIGGNFLYKLGDQKWNKFDLSNFDENDRMGSGILIGDIINDGSIEILNTHSDQKNQKPRLYTLSNYTKWLTVIPKLRSGGIAKNAVVVITTSKNLHVKVASSGSSPFSSRIPEAHFGIKNDEKILKVKILYSGSEFVFKKDEVKTYKKNILLLK